MTGTTAPKRRRGWALPTRIGLWIGASGLALTLLAWLFPVGAKTIEVGKHAKNAFNIDKVEELHLGSLPSPEDEERKRRERVIEVNSVLDEAWDAIAGQDLSSDFVGHQRLIAERDLERAHRLIVKAENLGGEHSRTKYIRAHWYLDKGMVVTARDAFMSLVRESPENPAFHLGLARSYSLAAIRNDGDTRISTKLPSLSSEQRRLLELANDAAEAAIEIVPERAGPRATSAVYLMQLGRTDAALNRFLEAEARLVRGSSSVAFFVEMSLGLLLGERGDIDGALSRFIKANAIDGQNAQIHFNLGVCHYTRKEAAIAEREFVRSVEIDPTSEPRSYFYLGAICAERGDFQAAERYFTNAIESGINDTATVDSLKFVKEAQRR